MKNEWSRLVWFNSSEMNFKEITWLVYILLYVKIVGILVSYKELLFSIGINSLNI